jgi:hypothetical protein
MVKPVQVPNSLLLVKDRDSVDIPATMHSRLTSATSSCVAVGTRSAAEGPVRIALIAGDVINQPGLPAFVAWEGTLETPSEELVLESVLGETYDSLAVGERAPVRVRVNDMTEPDEIWVVVG